MGTFSHSRERDRNLVWETGHRQTAETFRAPERALVCVIRYSLYFYRQLPAYPVSFYRNCTFFSLQLQTKCLFDAKFH
jgi:hypothetical protein